MADYGKEIRATNDRRAKVNASIASVLKDLGSRAVDVPPENQPEGMEDLVREYEKTRDILETASSAIERMMDIDTRQNEIKQAMKTLRTEREELGQGLSGVYEQIGAVAFRLFKESPLIDAGYSSAFEALARYQDEIRTLENKLKQLNQGHEDHSKRGILKRLRTSGKDMYLRNRKNARENRLPGLLQTTGEQLAQGDFITQVNDEELNRVSEPLRVVKQRWDEIDAELQQLADESGRLVEEFNSLSGGRGFHRARGERETEIADAREKMNDTFLTIGKIVEEQRPEEFSETIEYLEKLRRQVAECDTRLARLHAGRQMEVVSRELDSCRKQQEKTHTEIAELKERLRKLKEEESALESQLQQLESERGDPAELFET